MFKEEKIKQNNKGFSLVELIIVVAILAILIGILAPQYVKYVEKTKKAADVSNMQEIIRVIQNYEADGLHQLKATKYEIIIGWKKGGTTDGTAFNELSKDGTQVEHDEELREELNQVFPNWMSLLTKSKKWGNQGKPSAIRAIIEITSDGSMVMSYTPQKFAEYMAGEYKQ